jgi:hypothetical protein
MYGDRQYSCTQFDSHLSGSEWLISHPDLIDWWVPEPLWTHRRTENLLPLSRFEPRSLGTILTGLYPLSQKYGHRRKHFRSHGVQLENQNLPSTTLFSFLCVKRNLSDVLTPEAETSHPYTRSQCSLLTTIRNVSLGTVARLRTGRIRARDWIPGSGKKQFFFSKASRPALCPTQNPLQYVNFPMA